MDVGLARAEIAAFDRIVEDAMNTVAVVLVILRGVDAALCGDAVGPARTVLDAERFDAVTEFRQRSRRRTARQSRPDDDDLVLTLIGWVDEFDGRFVRIPFLRYRAGGNVSIEFHVTSPLPSVPRLESRCSREKSTRR